MTLGGKIKYARKCSGLSQEQLAERMCVSRSAIAKWETGKGMPDIENLKFLSRLLNISLDSLLDESADLTSGIIREPIHLNAYGRGCKKVKTDRMMQKRFAGASIHPLMGRPEQTDVQTTDSARGILTPVPFGAPEFIKSIRDLRKCFYLVEQDDIQYFVMVSDDHLEICPMGEKQTQKSFSLDGWTFIRMDYTSDI